ncbi:DUF4168 domain-containing protein [Halovulum dunhuangense]|uniref:DUF4168 domain-containing protein n=1 Tax=Halovulum dunhuangense TaxID=1505036 RepID=A0A849L1T4_9RHOB|nr:DUF4168 domain-containing protein [Halovulum dunhuangense]NNU80209.1 DUF4168 domain-containing protein [Halovulum dunhuangense]
MTIRNTLSAAALATGIAFGPIAAAGVMAQDAGSYGDAEITSFVMAALDVEEVRAAYQPRLQAATEEAEQLELIEQANQEMVQAIENADGITVEEYLEISDAMQIDPEMNARINEKFQELAPAE